MRRELFSTVVGGFVCGARLGGAVCGLALFVALLAVALTVGVTSESAPTSVLAAADAPHPSNLPPQKSRHAPPIDRALLEAARRLEADRALPLELGRFAPAPRPISTPAATAPAAPAQPPLILAEVALRALLEGYFPDQVDYALGVVMCESAGNVTANTGNGYYGLWQFDLPTWQSVGGSGLPSDASPEEQVARARALFDGRGWSPWECAW